MTGVLIFCAIVLVAVLCAVCYGLGYGAGSDMGKQLGILETQVAMYDRRIAELRKAA
jgi:hypothetical protein